VISHKVRVDCQLAGVTYSSFHSFSLYIIIGHN
jgi:hypothetical protein